MRTRQELMAELDLLIKEEKIKKDAETRILVRAKRKTNAEMRKQAWALCGGGESKIERPLTQYSASSISKKLGITTNKLWEYIHYEMRLKEAKVLPPDLAA